MFRKKKELVITNGIYILKKSIRFPVGFYTETVEANVKVRIEDSVKEGEYIVTKVSDGRLLSANFSTKETLELIGVTGDL